MSRLLTALALALLCTCLAWQGPTSATASASTGDVLGLDADALLDRFGPPHRIVDGGLSRWLWRTADGATIGVVLHEDHVVHVAPGFAAATLQREPQPATGGYRGQRVGALVLASGNPDAARTVPLAAGPGFAIARHPQQPTAGRLDVLVYGRNWVVIGGGRVIDVMPIPTQRADGPR